MNGILESQTTVDGQFWDIVNGQLSEALAVETHDVAESQSHIDAATLAVWGLEQYLAGDNKWLSVDQLPSLHDERERTDAGSRRLLDQRQELLNEGDFAAVPYAFDVLSTGKKLLKAEQMYGRNSNEYRKIYAGYHLDCKRHIAEAYRRLTSEYYGPVVQDFDAVKDSYTYGGYVLTGVVDNGLSQVGSEPVGIDVLIANRREEYTATAVGKLAALALEQTDVRVDRKYTMFTISQIATSAQTMIWAFRFDPNSGKRIQEQFSFIKDHITHDDVVELYRRKGAIDADANPTETELLGIQSISFAEEGVLGVMQQLDEIASERSGLNLFRGEVVPDRHVKDYAAIPAEAAARQDRQENEVAALEQEILRLAGCDTDGWIGNHMIDTFVTKMLLDKVAQDPSSAQNIFGKETAQKIQTSISLRERGEIEAADRAMAAARANAPLAMVCTGGSCGLESVDRNTAAGKEIAEAVKAEAGDTIVIDKERACTNPDCRQKRVVYSYNANKVNKVCMACKKFESRINGRLVEERQAA